MSFLDKMKQIASETEVKQQIAQDERGKRRMNLIDAQLRALLSLSSLTLKRMCGAKGHGKVK